MKIVVVGFGNILMGDEGIGVFAVNKARELSDERVKTGEVEFIDGGTSAFDVLLNLRNVDKLIIIDAVKNGGMPGEIYQFHNFTISQFRKSGIQDISLHSLGIIDALEIVKKNKQLPKEIVFVGIEPKEIKPQIGISEEIEKKIPEVIDIIKLEINHMMIQN